MSEEPSPRFRTLPTALTWVPAAVLRELTWASDVESEADALASVADALDVDLVWVPSAQAWAAEAVAVLLASGRTAIWAVDGVLTRVAAVHGWPATLRLSAAKPGDLSVAIDRALLDVLADVHAGVAAGAHALLVADELAGPAGWLVAPDFAFDSLLPAYAAVARAHEGAAGDLVFHSDGDVRALMPALRQAGFDCIHLASLSAPLLETSVRSAWAAGLSAIGGIPAASLGDGASRPFAERAAQLASEGRLVVADDGGLASVHDVHAYARALGVARSGFDAALD